MSEAPPATPLHAALDPPDPTEILRPDRAEVPLDPNQDVLTQIMWHAADLERDGLEGLTYTVDDVKYVLERDTTHHVTAPRIKMRRLLPSFSRQTGGAHTYDYVPEETEYFTVKSYGHDGEPQDVRLFAGPKFSRDEKGLSTTLISAEESEYGKFLNDLVKKRIENRHRPPTFRLEKLKPEPETETRVIPVDLRDRDKTVLESVFHTAEAEALPDGLVGLTWTRDGLPRRIIEDTTHFKATFQGPQAERKFIIEVATPDGRVVNQFSLSPEGLKKHLQVMNTPPSPPLDDLRFEVAGRVIPESEREPKDPLARWYWNEQRAWAGWLATAPETVVTPTGPVGETLSENDAIDMLASVDIYGKDDTRQRQLAKKIRADHQDYIKEAQAMVGEVGSDELRRMAERMRDQYLVTIKKLGLSVMAGDKSLSWAYQEMARRHYLSQHHRRVRPTQDKGAQIHNPVGKDANGRLTRLDIVDMRVGFNYVNRSENGVLHRTEKPSVRPVRIPGAAPDEDQYREVKAFDVEIDIDHDYLRLLQPFARDEVEGILKKAEHGRAWKAKPLTSGEYARIGALLGRGVNQRLSEEVED